MGIVFLPLFSFEAEMKAGDLIGIPLDYPGLPKASLKICKRRETELFLPAVKLVDYLVEAAGAR